MLQYVGVNVNELIDYINHMNDLPAEGEESLEAKIKKQKEKESTDFGDLLERYKKSMGSQDQNPLRQYEKNQDEDIKNSSKEEIEPMIIFVEFLRWFGINPYYILGSGKLEAIDSKKAGKGAFSRENVLFWINNETMKSHLSTGMIVSTVGSSGIGTMAGTLAYIDVEARTIYNNPGKFVLLKTGQWASSSVQSHVSSLITSLTFNTFSCSKFSNQFSDKAKYIIRNNLAAGVSFGVGGATTILNGNYRKKSVIDNVYDISETIIKNNGQAIHSYLIEQYTSWKTMTESVTTFGSWASEFLTKPFADTWLYKMICPYASYAIGLINPSNTLVYSTIMVLSSRLIKSTIIGTIGYARKLFGYDNDSEKTKKQNENEEKIRREREILLENKSLIEMYNKINTTQSIGTMKNIGMNLEERVFRKMLEKELIERNIICRRFQFYFETPISRPNDEEVDTKLTNFINRIPTVVNQRKGTTIVNQQKVATVNKQKVATVNQRKVATVKKRKGPTVVNKGSTMQKSPPVESSATNQEIDVVRLDDSKSELVSELTSANVEYLKQNKDKISNRLLSIKDIDSKKLYNSINSALLNGLIQKNMQISFDKVITRSVLAI